MRPRPLSAHTSSVTSASAGWPRTWCKRCGVACPCPCTGLAVCTGLAACNDLRCVTSGHRSLSAIAAITLQALDAYVDAPADQQHEALQAALQRRAAELAPPIGAEIGGVRISARQQKPLQELRNVFVCVRSEAARFGPDRCGAHARTPIAACAHPRLRRYR